MAVYLIYLAPLVLIWIAILSISRRREKVSVARKAEAQAAGLIEPASLHPRISQIDCIGCGACVSACPEGDILGMVRGKVELLEPTHCIGHGACAAACPVGAIELVFGTERRGVDIPDVGADFQTNVPGIYIAGELGGMGLIRNAIEQGRQAMEQIAKRRNERKGPPLDVVVIGAGPAGLSASLGAMKAELAFVTLEQDSLGGTVAHFPRGKLVMTAPAELPIVGKVNLRETSKEALMTFWEGVVADTGLTVRHGAQVTAIEPEGAGFRVITPDEVYHTAAVLLTIGRRGTPRKLGVPGEDRSKVVYRLIDAEQYRGMHVLVVGGGDSAIEAACSIADEVGTEVILSYRGEAFSRCKPKNRDRAERLAEAGRLRLAFGSTVQEIGETDVLLDQKGTPARVRNDIVIVCAGGILPTAFLQQAGVRTETKYGTA